MIFDGMGVICCFAQAKEILQGTKEAMAALVAELQQST